MRHARVLAPDAQGELVQIAPNENAKANVLGRHERAPAWFTRLVEPLSPRHVPVMFGGKNFGTIVIVGEPGDELAEVWEEVSNRATIWGGITAVMLVLLYIILGRLLNRWSCSRAACTSWRTATTGRG